jgi:peptidyl-prolyl cis-trans isomerase D
MFEFVRNHKKWMQILLALLIVPSFVAVGVSSYGSGGAGGGEIANVGGKKITQYEFDEAQRRYIDNARSQMGDRFNPKEYETPEVKQMILDKLIENAAIDAEIRASHMTVGDAALQKSIAEIQAFHKPDGSFDLDKYKALLGASNMTPRQFDAQTRSDMTKRQLGAAIPGSAFVPRSVANRLSDIADQEREVQELLFPMISVPRRSKSPTTWSRPSTTRTRPCSSFRNRPRSNTWCSIRRRREPGRRQRRRSAAVLRKTPTRSVHDA